MLETGGPVLTPWRDQVPAILEAWYPGEDGGTAIARVLFGDVDPGGRLPATFPRREADLPTAGEPERTPASTTSSSYNEGVLVGYRWFDAQADRAGVPVRLRALLHDFALRNLRVRADAPRARRARHVRRRQHGRPHRRGRAPALPRPARSARAFQPPRQLKGFDSVKLRAGATKRVRFKLDRRAFSYWNSAKDAGA